MDWHLVHKFRQLLYRSLHFNEVPTLRKTDSKPWHLSADCQEQLPDERSA